MGRKKSCSIIVEGDGPPCPRCEGPTEIHQHFTISAKILAQPFYYSEWYFCANDECKTTLIMPDNKKVFRERADKDKSFAKQLIEAQLDYAMTGKCDDEFVDHLDPPWDD